MTISLKARQAHIDALNTTLAAINKEIKSPTGFVDLDEHLLTENPLYVEALAYIRDRLEGERDDAALRLYRIADRRARKQEMREAKLTVPPNT